MQQAKTVTSGLVLRQTVTKETDLILTVLTPDLGKIPVIARGARRKNSRLAAACQLLAYSELTVYQKGAWYMLDEASTIELFDGVRQDFENLALASFFAELTESVAEEGSPAPELLRLRVIDEVILEPAGGAHLAPAIAYREVDQALFRHLSALSRERGSALTAARYEKFRRMGVVLPSEDAPRKEEP